MKHNENSSERLGSEPIVPLLIKLSIPSITAMAIQAMYNVVDSIYVGRLGTDPLSALSLAFPVQMILIGVAVGTGVGANSLIARMLGRGRQKDAENAAGNALSLAFLYGMAGLFVGFFFPKEILSLFTDEEILVALGSEYIGIILMGSIFMFIPMLSNNILRGQGNTFTPMITMLIGSVINIIIDPFFIFGIWIFPEWGIAGAAFATILSRFISGVFILIILFSKKNELHLHLPRFKPNPDIIKKIYSVGFPAMLMQLLGSFMLAGMNRILATYSTTAIAVAGLYFRLQSFVFMPIIGLNQGFLPIMGYNYGRNNTARMKKVFLSALSAAFVFSTLGLVVFQSIPETLVRLFNDDPELVKMGTVALKTISLSFPLAGPGIFIVSAFQALGRGFPGLVISILRMLVILMPLMYILGMFYGLDAMWYAFPVTELISTSFAGTWLFITFRKLDIFAS